MGHSVAFRSTSRSSAGIRQVCLKVTAWVAVTSTVVFYSTIAGLRDFRLSSCNRINIEYKII